MGAKVHNTLVVFYVLVFLALGLGPIGTHIITCLSEDRWGFLIAGALAFPIGWIHGVGIWVGAW